MRSFGNPFSFIFLLISFVFISKTSKSQVGEFDLLKSQYNRLTQQQKLDSALFVARQMNDWAFRNEGDTSLRYALSFKYLGGTFYNLDLDSAKYFWQKSLDMLNSQHREESIHAAQCYQNLGLYYLNKTEYDLSQSLYIRAKNIYEKLTEKNIIDYAQCLFNLGVTYTETLDVEMAEKWFLETLELYKDTFGNEAPEYVSILEEIVRVFWNIDYNLAERYCEDLLRKKKDVFGANHIQYANTLSVLGDLNFYYFNNKKSEDCYKEAIKIFRADEKLYPDYIFTLDNLGRLYSRQAKFQMSLECHTDALKYAEYLLGIETPEYACILNNLGALHFDEGHEVVAYNYFTQALDIFKVTLGEKNPYYSATLNNLGLICINNFEFSKAELFFSEALEILKNTSGANHPDYAETLNNLGLMFFRSGNFVQAESYYKLAFDVYTNTLGQDHPECFAILCDLGELYSRFGKFTSAELSFRLAQKICKNTFGVNHPKYALILGELGNLYSDLGDYKSSEKYFAEALCILKNKNGFQDKNYGAFMANKGALHFKSGDFKSAMRCAKQALKIHKKSKQKEDIDYATLMSNFGNIYSVIGKYKTASKYYQKANHIYYSLLGSESQENILSLVNLAKVSYDLGNINAAINYYGELLGIRKDLILKNFSLYTLSDLNSMQKVDYPFNHIINLFSSSYFTLNPNSIELSYNEALLSKSLMLEMSVVFDRLCSQVSDENLKINYEKMKEARRIVCQMQSEGSENKNIIERNNILADSLDEILVKNLGEYAAAKHNFEITWKDVQNSLSPNDAAIEFASYYDEIDSTQKSFALVVRPSYEYPKLVKIGAEPEIKEAIQIKDFSTLYSLVWQGLDSLLEGVDKVYYSPDGELNNLSFSGLYERVEGSDSISYLIDRYELHQLTTTRYLADGTLSKQKPFEASAALLGGIDFNQIPSVDAASKGEESNEDYLLQLNLDKEIQQNRSSSFSSKMPPLKGTEIEVKTISGLLNHSGWNTTSYTGQSAGENQIKYDLLQKSPGVLHIATHGFAFPDIIKKESYLMQMNEKSTYKASEDPMVRCGLMLSGSNISWAGEPKKMIEQTGDDGILTAAEVANMDLSNTKLVVLSACETGLGKIEGSEGTFGLKRAFKLAGVEQLIVSLWSVPDKETMELMTLFYTDLTLTKDPTVSYAKAQREMRYRYPYEPEKWAGFVLVR